METILKKLILGALIGAMLGIPVFIAFQFPLIRTFFSTLGMVDVSVRLPEMLEIKDWTVFASLGAVAAAIADRLGYTMVVAIVCWAGGLFLLYGNVGAGVMGLLLGMFFDFINQKFENA